MTNTFVSFRFITLPRYTIREPRDVGEFSSLESYDNGDFRILRYHWMLDAQLSYGENYDINKSAAGLSTNYPTGTAFQRCQVTILTNIRGGES